MAEIARRIYRVRPSRWAMSPISLGWRLVWLCSRSADAAEGPTATGGVATQAGYCRGTLTACTRPGGRAAPGAALAQIARAGHRASPCRDESDTEVLWFRNMERTSNNRAPTRRSDRQVVVRPDFVRSDRTGRSAPAPGLRTRRPAVGAADDRPAFPEHAPDKPSGGG